MDRQRIGNGLTRASLLQRGAIGGGALLASASGLAAFAPAAFADGPPVGDLAYLRLLIAAELLAGDFSGQALASGALRRPASALVREIRGNEHAHYETLAALMTAAGQIPATAADIDFAYPAGTFASERVILRFARKLEGMLVGAYIDALEHVTTAGYREAMARILANEAQHHSALASLTGERMIEKPFPRPVRQKVVSNFLDRYES